MRDGSNNVGFQIFNQKGAGGRCEEVMTVARLDGNLAVSRGFGDFRYKEHPTHPPGKQKVSCLPELHVKHDMEDDDLVNFFLFLI